MARIFLALLIACAAGCSTRPLSIDGYPFKSSSQRIAGLNAVRLGDTPAQVLQKAGRPDYSQVFLSDSVIFPYPLSYTFTYLLPRAPVKPQYLNMEPKVEVNFSAKNRTVSYGTSRIKEVEDTFGGR